MFAFISNLVSLLASFFGLKAKAKQQADDKKIDQEEQDDADLKAAVKANTTRADFTNDDQLLVAPDQRK